MCTHPRLGDIDSSLRQSVLKPEYFSSGENGSAPTSIKNASTPSQSSDVGVNSIDPAAGGSTIPGVVACSDPSRPRTPPRTPPPPRTLDSSSDERAVRPGEAPAHPAAAHPLVNGLREVLLPRCDSVLKGVAGGWSALLGLGVGRCLRAAATAARALPATSADAYGLMVSPVSVRRFAMASNSWSNSPKATGD
jgi:hypothetical protein